MNAILTKVPKTIGVSEFRAGLAGHLAAAKKSPLVVADRRGSDSYVVLDADIYNELLELWEDAEASRTLEQLVKEQKGKKFYPFKPSTR